MGGKQMEGDNARRRRLARLARALGRRASELGLTLGASKQPEHVDSGHRAGPPAAGPHKDTLAEQVHTGPPASGRAWPHWDPPALGIPAGEPRQDASGGVRYRSLVSDVAHRTGLSFDEARSATEATVAALAGVLPGDQRLRLAAALPGALHDYRQPPAPHQPRTAEGFLGAVQGLAGQPPEQARYRAQAVLSALADHDPELFDVLGLSPDIRALAVAPPIGGGIVDPGGHVAALTDDELRAALARLPEWSGDRHGLARTIELPSENLDRVLDRLELLRREVLHGPHIGRRDDRTATIVVRTSSIGAVSRLDVELAHRVDATIDEAGAGMSAG